MASDIKLHIIFETDIKLKLKEEYLKTNAIIFETEGFDLPDCEDFELYEREQDDSALMINVHRDTGEVLLIFIEQFKSETEYAIKMLREYPLPWTFSLPELKIKEKPLEDVLLAVYKKYKNIKIIGD